jgi:hypothetical protein
MITNRGTGCGLRARGEIWVSEIDEVFKFFFQKIMQIK